MSSTKMSSAMNQDYTLGSLRLKLLETDLRVKAIIMDINNFRGTIVELEILNEAGREKLAELRKCIEQLEDLAHDENDGTILQDVEKYRAQLFSTQQAFRKANITAMLEISKANKEELFALRPDASEVRKRHTTSSLGSKAVRSSALLMQHESVTERMHSISQQLFETTQKSAATLDLLVANSATVQSTADELLQTAGTIKQSHKLLEKYSRRDCTDKILAAFGLTLFLVSVIYVLSRRLF
ncbi:vesicle transport protein SEC20-like [Anopheles ziemanni]|uniref:vesicle transport protein SEC20-like n=1 Tax=Anopheles coustani TaxID=139045 RepID=UPI0026588FCC|nr:vesicle transport protein SEC20-like [Anopheles coustani]XP_058176069.1 vesicle transport protein SEC20-like [Anopheles ziemanni]